MALLFARQPIFDKKNKIYGYELLYRDEQGAMACNCDDGDAATCNVMAGGFLSMGVDEIVNKGKAFINFTDNMILSKVATLFPKEKIVVELLEDIDPTSEIIEACRSLKKDGYTLALDDFVFRPGYEALIECADIIKVDFLIDKTESQRRIIYNRYNNGRIKFLAEKIETIEDFNMAVNIGYSLFQGYYFSKPVVVSSKEIPPSKMNHIKLISMLEKKDPIFDDISNVIEKDVAFSYEILRIANTAHYYRGNKINSIRQAAVRMGLVELKKWALITVLRKMSGKNQDAVISYCAQRAKAMELISHKIGLEERKLEFFTLGMLSMVDVLTSCSMEIVVQELAVSDEVKQLLLGQEDDEKMSICFSIVKAYEKAEWDMVTEFVHKIGIEVEDVADAYYNALIWVNTGEV